MQRCNNCNYEFEGNFCPNCGTSATAEAKVDHRTYCTNCGKESESRICKHCGVKNRVVHNYCAWCGMKLDANAVICPGCKEEIKQGRFWKILAVMWIIITAFLVVGFMFIDYNPIGGLLFVVPMVLVFPFVGKLIRKITHDQPNRKVKRLLLNIARITLAIFLLFPAYSIAIRIEAPHPSGPNSFAELSSYTYDEYVMYSTITKGYGQALDALKNPKTADFFGIGYNTDSEMVYFCVIAENDFGANTKCYISYSKKYDKLDESDDLKYYYDTAEIKRTMEDLYAFMEAVKNADESDVPTQGRNEALESYSKAEREIYDLLIAGLEDLGVLYDDLLIVGYRYSSDSNSALFYFTGEDAGGELVMTYAKYSDGLGLMVLDAYKSMYDNADTEVLAPQIDEYKEALKKDITK